MKKIIAVLILMTLLLSTSVVLAGGDPVITSEDTGSTVTPDGDPGLPPDQPT